MSDETGPVTADEARPIGYVVLMRLPHGDAWEPCALTRDDDSGANDLLVRSCFSMFPSEEDATQALRALQGRPGIAGTQARVCAVFPANIAAPHTTGGRT